jgi:uncharacterized protein with HEPN domain
VKKDVRVYIDDVLECIDKVEEYTEGVGEEEFYENTQIQDAIYQWISENSIRISLGERLQE